MKKVLKLVAIIAFAVAILIIAIYYNSKKSGDSTVESKFSTLNNQLMEPELKQFFFDRITESQNGQTINISFTIPKSGYKSFNSLECIDDIITVREVLTGSLESNDAFKNKKINVLFNALPGNSIYMRNYEQNNNDFIGNSFQFYENLYLPFDYWNSFNQARKIGIIIKSESEISNLSIFSGVQELSISESDISNKSLYKITEILPDSTVYYNGAIYSNK